MQPWQHVDMGDYDGSCFVSSHLNSSASVNLFLVQNAERLQELGTG